MPAALWCSRHMSNMNGAESLVHTLIANGISTCFANPGTSEMHFVAALDRIPGLRCIPGLQENVVTGMADGYGRIARNPAVTLLHCGPGLANGLANLHNARRARSPIVNIVGDQASYHAQYDPPLAADTASLARSVSHWVRTAASSDRVGQDAAEAVAAARSAPGQVATLILPSDSSWNAGGIVGGTLDNSALKRFNPALVHQAADVLRSKSNVLLLLGSTALRAEAQIHAARIAAKTGCSVMAESIIGFHQRGQGRMAIERIPYPVDAAIAALKDVKHIILAGSRAPVGFFAYPGKPSLHAPADVSIHALSAFDEDSEWALEDLADMLSAPFVGIASYGRPDVPHGLPSSEGLGRMMAAIMPDNAIVADEAITYGANLYAGSHAGAPHDWMMVTGGAIGYGMPCATGAAVAGAGRRVINLQADGSAMYTIQSLWTQAREKLPVTTIILNNRKYQILLGEYASVGANPGRTALDMLDLGNPDINFVKMANSMGVDAARATMLEECADLLQSSFKRNEPFLIELMI